MIHWLWLGGVASALAACETHHLSAKLAVPACCAAAVFLAGRSTRRTFEVLPIAIAFACSIAGDFFLSNRAGRTTWFLAGIAAYLAAHLGYITYSLGHGRLHRPTLVTAFLAIMGFYALVLLKRLPDPRLLLAVGAYALVSCASLAVAAGLRLPRPPKSRFVLGIGLLLSSDTVIALVEFCHWRGWGWFILPTYYLALLLIAQGVVQSLNKRPPLQRQPARSVQ